MRVGVCRALVRLLAAFVLCSAIHSAAGAPNERYRVFHAGRWVDYFEQEGLAIAEGDILLGDAATVARVRESPVPLKALTLDSADLLWPAAPSGVHEVPYVYEAGPQANIDLAIALFNSTFAGIIQWVPRGAQSDYVAFSLVGPAGSCFSEVGRTSGRQIIGGSTVCSVGALLHEMGHAIGFWHTQSDAAQGSYLDIRYDIMDPRWRSQYTPILDARELNGYDYASIMHYTPFVQSTAPDQLTGITIPRGIDIGLRAGYSAGDVDAVKRLYGAAPTTVTVTSNPPGLEVIIDGAPSITPVELHWKLGSLHRLDVRAEPQFAGSSRYAFGRWSHDPSPMPVASQEWIVEP